MKHKLKKPFSWELARVITSHCGLHIVTRMVALCVEVFSIKLTNAYYITNVYFSSKINSFQMWVLAEIPRRPLARPQ